MIEVKYNIDFGKASKVLKEQNLEKYTNAHFADKTARLYLDNGYDYDKLKNSLSSEIDFAGDLNSSSEMKLHLATVLIKKVLSKLEN